MSNLGLYKAFDELGINYVKTDVGDKYVHAEMDKHGYELGGCLLYTSDAADDSPPV